MFQGDPDAKIAELRQRTTVIRSRVIQQMKNLLSLGHSFDVIVKNGILTARHMPGTVALVEEGHASGALAMRHHPERTDLGLYSHTDIHQMRALFTHSVLEKTMNRLDEKLARLAARQPQKATPRQMYLKYLVAQNAPAGGRANLVENKEVSQECVKQHGAMFRALPPASKLELKNDSDRHIAAKKQEIRIQEGYLCHILEVFLNRF